MWKPIIGGSVVHSPGIDVHRSLGTCAFVERACRRGYKGAYVRLPRSLQQIAEARGDGSYSRRNRPVATLSRSRPRPSTVRSRASGPTEQCAVLREPAACYFISSLTRLSAAMGSSISPAASKTLVILGLRRPEQARESA